LCNSFTGSQGRNLRQFRFVTAAAVALGVLCFASPASALNFLQPTGSPYSTGKLESNSVRTGDLNDDGRDDVFTTNADPSVSIFLANADGSMAQAPGSPIFIGDYAPSGNLGDFTNDGDLDIATASDEIVRIRRGSGEGTFSSPSAFVTESNGSDIATADFTGDGNLDLLVLGYSEDNVSLLPGNGDGTFDDPVTFPVPGGPVSVTVADFNGDSFPDFATANLDVQVDGLGAVTVMLNDGTGGFTQAPSSPYAGYFQPRGITSGDFDGDGNADLSVVSRTDQHLLVLLGGGDGLFTAAAAPTIDSNWGNSVASADFDGDGYDDILVGMSTNITDPLVNSAAIFLGNSSGNVVRSPDGPWPTATGANPWRVATGDFNDDGHPDWVSGDPGGKISVFMNEAPALTADPTTLSFPNVPVGGVSAPLSVTVTSTGIGPVSIPAGGVTITGLNASDYQIDSDDCASQTLNTGDSCQVDVVFSPEAFGGKNAQLEIAHDATGSPTTVVLSGFGTANPGIAIDPTSHDFGSRVITVQSSSQTFTIESTGTTPLDIGLGNISITGADAGQFSIESDDCSGGLVQPEDTCEVTVKFAPTTVGAKTASLSISSNAPNGPHTAALSGTGSPYAYPVFSPADITDFGRVPVGTGPAGPRTVTVTAAGASPLEIEQLYLRTNFGDYEDFDVPTNTCAGQTLQVGDTCQFTVTFEPGATGDRAALMGFVTPGLSGIYQLGGQGVDPDYTLTPTTHDFGTRLTDAGPGEPQTFTLTSTGTTDLLVGAVHLDGASSDQFQVTSNGCYNQVLAPGTSCEVSVEFDPTTAGEKVADLKMDLFDLDVSATAQLTGSGQDPVPPPDPCEPVAVKKVKYYTPSIKKRSDIPGVRARITTAGPADVRISSKVIYHSNGKQGSISYGQHRYRVTADSLNYKVAIPKKLRAKLKPKKQVRFVISYASKSTNPECTKFGEKKTRNLTTRVVWVIPNG